MITVVKSGLFTTVQDGGRFGYQTYGMPVAGIMDRYAYTMANLLVGNSQEAAVLELTVYGGVYRLETAAWISFCGADMQGKLNDQPLVSWAAVYAAAGSVLSFGYAQSGCRGYLAVGGGIDTPVILGSRATYTRAAIGGLNGRPVKAGDCLKLGLRPTEFRRPVALSPALIPEYGNEYTLRVLLGPQDDYFTDEAIYTIFNNSYTITADADRMGYRLEGPVIKHRGKADIVSDALCMGAIQVPGHGMPIIMMADCQTTGGYAKIGVVIGSDLMLLAQAKPGDRIKFTPCTDSEAVQALVKERTAYKEAAKWVAIAQTG